MRNSAHVFEMSRFLSFFKDNLALGMHEKIDEGKSYFDFITNHNNIVSCGLLKLIHEFFLPVIL